nr:ribonuclease H-like domain-containing protein [Tanacetum cinerariifolium]
NKPNVTGRGPEWIFVIDSLTYSMNYEPITAGNQPNNDAGIEINANAGKAGQEKASNHEYILLPFMHSSTQSSDDKDMKGIKREFSVARTPQQNEVDERKNRTLIEADRTMLADLLLPTTF